MNIIKENNTNIRYRKPPAHTGLGDMGGSPTSRFSYSINLNWKNISIVLGFQDWYIILHIILHNWSEHISFLGL